MKRRLPSKQKDTRKAKDRVGRRPPSQAVEYTPYDLSVLMKDLSGDAIAPMVLGVVPTEEEREEYRVLAEKEGEKAEEIAQGRMKLAFLPESYRVLACPLWRCLRARLSTLKVVKTDAEGKAVEHEKLPSSEKEDRYNLAHDIMSAVRHGEIKQMPLSSADIRRLQVVCDDLDLEARGFVYDALSAPQDADDDPDELDGSDEAPDDAQDSPDAPE